MDRFMVATGAPDADLMVDRMNGWAYQADRQQVVAYDAPYYDKCAGYDGLPIAEAINEGRIEFVGRFIGQNRLLDVGIGSGEFIRKRPNTYGLDVNPVAIEWLNRNDLRGEPRNFSNFSFWDVIEHCETPELYLKHIPLHGFAFFSLPIFDNLDRIRESKHYRPGEHLQYFEDRGFVRWMGLHGFMLLERADYETRAGRESIGSYAFKRFGWPRDVGKGAS